MAYTTLAKVCAELGIASSTITASSVPSTSDIDAWIGEAKAEIDLYSGRVWESTAISSSAPEYYDYDGSGSLLLFNRPVISVEKLEIETMGVGATSSSWTTLTEGRTSSASFELYKDEGIVRFHPSTESRPLFGSRNVRVAYTHGKSTTPLIITRLATMIVAERYITTFANASAGSQGGSITVGPISISDPGSFSINRLNNIRSEKERLFKLVGTTKSFAPTYNF